MKPIDIRLIAVQILSNVQENANVNALMDNHHEQRARLQAMVLGALREWHANLRLLESLQVECTHNKVRSIFMLAMYELLNMNAPAHAVIDGAVQNTKRMGVEWSSGLVNAVLRKIAQNTDKFYQKQQKHHSLPNALAKIIKNDHSEHYASLSQALRQMAPIFLRVNALKTDTHSYGELLRAHGVAHTLIPVMNGHCAIRLDMRIKVHDLPKFAEGWVSVQDKHAQLAGCIIADTCDIKNARILDAACAPAGKFAHLLELGAQNILGLDIDKMRLELSAHNLMRLGVDKAIIDEKLQCADASAHVGEYDMVLLDAPCTATGVARRHPELLLRRDEMAIAQAIGVQSMLLDNLWRSVVVGGHLLYATCSILRDENDRQITNFLARTPSARLCQLEIGACEHINVGSQFLPQDGGGDGFYYALLQKIS